MSPSTPILKVMRIQSPSLSSYYSTCTTYPTLIPNSISSTMLLPDSFGNIHTGETFLACLSVSNSTADESTAIDNQIYNNTLLPSSFNLTNVTINSYLQTPTQRHRLANPADSTNQPNGCTVALGGHVDVFVSQLIEEAGQHILRVEIFYNDHNVSNLDDTTSLTSASVTSSTMPTPPPPTSKIIRKFYRFQVTQPLKISSFVCRHGDSTCWISVDVENILPSTESHTDDGIGNSATTTSLVKPFSFLPCDNSPDLALTLSSVTFKPADGLSAISVIPNNSLPSTENDSSLSTVTSTPLSRLDFYLRKPLLSSAQLYDSIVRLRPHESHRYLFKVQAASENASIRGIAAGDALGQVQIRWRRSLSDTGSMTSPMIFTPTSIPSSILNRLGTLNSYIGDISKLNGAAAMDEMDVGFVVHASGLSVDTAAAAAGSASSYVTTHSKPLYHTSTSSLSSFRLEEILPVTVEPIDPPTKMVLGCTYPLELLIVNHGNTALHAHLQMRLSVMKGVVISGPSFINLGEIPPNGGSTAALIHVLALLPGLFQVRGCFIVDPTNGREIAQPALFSVYIYDDDEMKI